MEQLRIVLITNIPSPYRVFQFDAIAKLLGKNFCVFYNAKIEQNRDWSIPNLTHEHLFLKHRTIKVFGNKLYFNLDISEELNKYNPAIIITAGFNPTMLIAYWFALRKRKKHIMLTDSWLHSVNQLTILHRIIRRIIIKNTNAFICVGIKGKEYLKEYGAKENRIFISRLVINNEYFFQFINDAPIYDIMFSGQFIERKQPLFFCEVVKEIYLKKKNLKVLIIGNGPLRDVLLRELMSIGTYFYYPGFVQQIDLPAYYSNSKVLLFPTLDDPWGIVANEALAVGTPVITTKNAGVSFDLVLPGITGWVLDSDPVLWADKCLEIIEDKHLQKKFKINCLNHIQKYSINSSLEGFIDAIHYTVNQ